MKSKALGGGRQASGALCRGRGGLPGGQLVFVVVDVLGHLPDLEDVVLGDAGHHPLLRGVPREVRDLARVPAMDEEQLRRPVLRILWCLLLVDPAGTPNKTNQQKKEKKVKKICVSHLVPGRINCREDG